MPHHLQTLLVCGLARAATGVTCNTGSSTVYEGSCGTMDNTVSFTTTSCGGACFTESMKQEISPNGVCNVVFVVAGCVQTGTKDCATLQQVYDAMDPAAGNFGFGCEECSTDACNPTSALSGTQGAVRSGATAAANLAWLLGTLPLLNFRL
ncbi:unnamed protein product [Symbiodinium necroappetens]|uniref:Uncharacterized protein n=1 Tax=Symbiodinium necroappetens TaxID=1628268 RepID=A0A812UXC7_9DINO|nr:unnamed protein product [Symbiodinium necroappetens]